VTHALPPPPYVRVGDFQKKGRGNVCAEKGCRKTSSKRGGRGTEKFGGTRKKVTSDTGKEAVAGLETMDNRNRGGAGKKTMVLWGEKKIRGPHCEG